MIVTIQTLIQRMRTPHVRTIERRLHRRAVDYWRSRGGDGGPVRVANFDPHSIEDDSSHGFLLNLSDPAHPVLAHIGPVLEQEAGVEGSGLALASVSTESLLVRFASHYPRVVASGAPETAEYDFVTDAGYHVLCRGALLPLSSDGTTIDHVYGVVSWKSEKIART